MMRYICCGPSSNRMCIPGRDSRCNSYQGHPRCCGSAPAPHDDSPVSGDDDSSSSDEDAPAAVDDAPVVVDNFSSSKRL